jgi:alpha-aminoadipate/glutamate carrier protein LysW
LAAGGIKEKKMNQLAECPYCDAEVALAEDTVKDELLECDDCGTELLVISLAPLSLEEAPQAEEDWGQ